MSGGRITGIHHITAIAGDAQKNIDFYQGILGLRLVKKTVNFDAPDVYHFYYGDETGSPGTILTFFPFNEVQRGKAGIGMLNVISFSAPVASIGYWEKRLKRSNVEYNRAQERFGSEVVLSFGDSDGLRLELVFNDQDKRPGYGSGAVPGEYSIKGFFGAEIWEEGYERTAGLLTGQMDHILIAEKGNRFRFAAVDSPGNYVDIVCSPDTLRGIGGTGTVHHIAFSTPDTEKQLKVRERVLSFNPTPVIDRQYFKSVYFRESGGVLFEVATAEPGFTVDEDKEHLGESLKLPPQYESYRSRIEEVLPRLVHDTDKYKD